jgi:hypothetical protein
LRAPGGAPARLPERPHVEIVGCTDRPELLGSDTTENGIDVLAVRAGDTDLAERGPRGCGLGVVRGRFDQHAIAVEQHGVVVGHRSILFGAIDWSFRLDGRDTPGENR